MTNQEVFNKVYKGLIRQGKRSLNDYGECQYRIVKNGKLLRCAAGQLIPKKDYNPEFEGLPCYSGSERINIVGEYFRDENIDIVFLGKLQVCHDTTHEEDFVESFKDKMSRIAEEYGLTVPTL